MHMQPRSRGLHLLSLVLAGGDEQVGLVNPGFAFRQSLIFFWFGSNLKMPLGGLSPIILATWRRAVTAIPDSFYGPWVQISKHMHEWSFWVLLVFVFLGPGWETRRGPAARREIYIMVVL